MTMRNDDYDDNNKDDDDELKYQATTTRPKHTHAVRYCWVRDIEFSCTYEGNTYVKVHYLNLN